jgi:formylglycine-generating enzyme required for sulfatase activity
MAIGGKSQADFVIKRKKFPWFVAVGITAAIVVTLVLLLRDKRSDSGGANGPTGSIHIQSTPPGATVYRNGADTGLTTETTLNGVPVGTHAIKLTLSGYRDFEQSIEVTAGQTAEIQAVLVPSGVLEPEMVYIPGGVFMMGSESPEALPDEKPVHQVTLSDYWIGKYEVTQEQWVSVMGSNPSYYVGDTLPVNDIQWDDCQAFIRRLNELTGKSYRLPTEAEWEFAARAGTTGDRYGDLESVAWYSDNSGGTPHPVGGKAPNAFGLYDMLGNIFEWCWDWYDFYTAEPQIDPQGPETPHPDTQHHILRGGSWFLEKVAARAPFRSLHVPEHKYDVLGLRLARD